MFERTSIGTLLKCLKIHNTKYITDNCTEPPSSERYAALERSMNAQIEVEREHHQKMLIDNGNLQRQLQELQVLFITSSVFCVCTLVNRSVPHFIPHFVPHILYLIWMCVIPTACLPCIRLIFPSYYVVRYENLCPRTGSTSKKCHPIHLYNYNTIHMCMKSQV